MCHGNDRLINLAVGAVVVIAFLLIGRLKRSLRKPPSFNVAVWQMQTEASA